MTSDAHPSHEHDAVFGSLYGFDQRAQSLDPTSHVELMVPSRFARENDSASTGADAAVERGRAPRDQARLEHLEQLLARGPPVGVCLVAEIVRSPAPEDKTRASPPESVSFTCRNMVHIKRS